jgi:hypothetical protein
MFEVFSREEDVGYSVVNAPRVPIAVGLPVYNGEKFVRDAIESILGQTFGDFRLVIADNASTDATEEICRRYAARDQRITYHRHGENIGAAPNFNFAFGAARSKYFKWQAHDDVMGPEFLGLCYERMEDDPRLSVCHSWTVKIDAAGGVTGTYNDQIPLDGETPGERFTRILWVDHFTEIWGLMRSDIAKRTQLYRSYVGSDRTFLAEMLLRGRLAYVDQFQSFRRQHPECYSCLLQSHAEKVRWFDPNASLSPTVSGTAKIGHFIDAISHAPISASERMLCLKSLSAWAVRRGWEHVQKPVERYRPADLLENRPRPARIPEPPLAPRLRRADEDGPGSLDMGPVDEAWSPEAAR